MHHLTTHWLLNKDQWWSFSLRVRRCAGQGEAPLEDARWPTGTSRVLELRRTEGALGLEDSTNRLLCWLWAGLRGKGSSTRRGPAAPPPSAPFAGPFGSGSPRLKSLGSSMGGSPRSGLSRCRCGLLWQSSRLGTGCDARCSSSFYPEETKSIVVKTWR